MEFLLNADQIYLFTNRIWHGLFCHILTFLIFYYKLSYLLIVFDMDSWVSLFSNSKFIYLLILLGMDFFYHILFFYFLVLNLAIH